MPKLIKLLSLFLVMSTVSCGTKTKEEKAELPAEIVDRIDLIDLEGKEINISELKGKTIFLNFWATWCRPCIAEMPDIDEAAKMLGTDEFVFIAASDESIDKIRDYVEDVDYTFQFVKSKRSVFDMEIMALPTTIIINKAGKIVYNEVGARKWNSNTELDRLRKIASE